MRVAPSPNLGCVVLASSLCMPLLADVEVFEDHGLWSDRASEFFIVEVIDFEEIVVSEDARFAEIAGTEFEGRPGSPRLSSKSESPFGVVLSEGGELSPVSGTRLFFAYDPFVSRSPCCSEIITVEFAEPVVAFGAWFLDVEIGFESTGFDLDRDGTPEVRFTHRNFVQGFLGFVTDSPVDSLDIHLSTATLDDGVGLDDLSYVLDRRAFLRGDANADGRIDVSDPVSVLSHLFLESETPTCFDALDANDSGRVDISDAIGILAHLFAGGFPPAAPFPACGKDLSEDPLGCVSYGACL